MNFVRFLFIPFLAFLSACTLDTNILKLQSAIEDISVDPVISVDAVPVANSLNQDHFTVTGTCVPASAIFNIVGAIQRTGIICTQGAWSTVLDLTSASEGAISLGLLTIANSSYDLDIIKDTVEPQNVQLTLESGATTTANATIDVEIDGTDIHEVYLTETAGCLSGGTWAAYQQLTSWNLSAGDGLKTLYLLTRDENSNVTTCQSQTITLNTSAPSIPSNVPAGKLADNFVFVNTASPGNAVYSCSINSASSCQKLPSFTSGGETARFVSAKKLLSGDVLATGSISESGVTRAIVLRYDSAGGSWSELDRYSYDPTSTSEGVALALSPLGSVAVVITAKDASFKTFLVTRELLHGQSTWTTTQFNLNGSIGSGNAAVYGTDESLYVAGTLWNASTNAFGVLRKKTAAGVWSTIETFQQAARETQYIGLDTVGDKVFISGWVATSPRQGLLRECVISTGACTNLNLGSLSSDTYNSKIISRNGDDLYYLSSVWPNYNLLHYNVTSNTRTLKHTYNPDPATSSGNLDIGMAADGRLWGVARYYESASDSYRPYLVLYDASGTFVTAHVYP